MSKRVSHGLTGIYNSTPLTLADGQGAALALDSAGRLVTSLTVTGSDIQLGAVEIKNGTDDTRLTVATDDSNMPATPPFLPTGGEYRASPTTYTDGDATVLQTDVNGNTKVTQATLLAGEDLTANVLKVEQRYSGSVVAADTLVKTGAGFLHTLTFSCNDAAPTAGSIIVYDNTAESGTQLFNHTFTTTPFVPFSVTLDVSFSTGLYVGFTTTADVNVTPSYR